MQFADYVVQDRLPEEFDTSVLHRTLFPVNIRLLKSSRAYRDLIGRTVEYMSWILDRKPTDYTQAKGISGANLAIPFNVAAIRLPERRYFINPTVTNRSEETETVMSNCGSLRLEKPIPTRRHKWVDVTYYDLDGKFHSETFYRENGGYTLQHEIEHNQGILITDKV